MSNTGTNANSFCWPPRRNMGNILRIAQIVGLLLIGWIFLVMHSSPCTCPEQDRFLASLQSANVLYQESTCRQDVSQTHSNTTIYDDIKLIEGAVFVAGLEEPFPPATSPKCKGDLQGQEVEDLLCIPRPKFIEGVKNPCWWHPPGNNSTENSEIRCLPYFHILGCEKCGSSDLWQRIITHQDTVQIQGTVNKEANWWGWQRYGYFVYRTAPIRNFSYYTSYFFKPLNTRIQTSLRSGGSEHKRLITGDGTPSDLMEFRGWKYIPQNRGLDVPTVLTPHLMKHLYPHPRFIVILRNPIHRLYSDYYFTNYGENPETFHAAVLKSIRILANCLRSRKIQQCFYDDTIFQTMPVRLHLMFYSIYIREWLKVIDRKNFLFLKFEEYTKNPISALKESFQFLNLPPLSTSHLKSIASLGISRVGHSKQTAGPMMPKTKILLDALVKPSNREFSELMKNSKFAWN